MARKNKVSASVEAKEKEMNTLTKNERMLVDDFGKYLKNILNDTEAEAASQRLQDAIIKMAVTVVEERKQATAAIDARNATLLAEISACAEAGDIDGVVEKTAELRTCASPQSADSSKKFVVKDHFVVNTGSDAVVKISGFYGNFEECFLNGAGKIEEVAGKTDLRHFDLKKNMSDKAIIKEFGGKGKDESFLADVWAMLEEQGQGQKGDLLTNGFANIFHIYDQNGVLRAVDVLWHGGGWGVGAFSVVAPSGWGAGRRAFSRNS